MACPNHFRLMMSGISWIAAVTAGISTDDAYWAFKEDLEKELTVGWAREQKITQIMESEKVMRHRAISTLREQEKLSQVLPERQPESD